MGTKRNESLRNITWHPQTETKDYGTVTKIRTRTRITNSPTTPVTIDDLPLSKLSPFAVQKGFQAVAGTLRSIKRLRDGSFLVECARKSQAMGLLKTTGFVDRPVRVSIHKALNSSRGVIRYRELSGMTEVEVRTELQEHSTGCS